MCFIERKFNSATYHILSVCFVPDIVLDVLCTQSCLTLQDPMHYSPPGSSVHGIFQARMLEWVAISSSRGSSQPGDLTCVSCIPCTAVGLFYHWATGASLTYVNSNLLSLSTSYILNHVRVEEIKVCSKSHSYFQWCWPAKPILFAFPSYLFHLLKAYSIYYRGSVHGKCPTHVFEWKKETSPREYYPWVENVSPEIFSWT